jgi:hypothetical protein
MALGLARDDGSVQFPLPARLQQQIQRARTGLVQGDAGLTAFETATALRTGQLLAEESLMSSGMPRIRLVSSGRPLSRNPWGELGAMAEN